MLGAWLVTGTVNTQDILP